MTDGTVVSLHRFCPAKRGQNWRPFLRGEKTIGPPTQTVDEDNARDLTGVCNNRAENTADTNLEILALQVEDLAHLSVEEVENEQRGRDLEPHHHQHKRSEVSIESHHMKPGE